MSHVRVFGCLLALALGCDREISGAERGAEHFRDPGLSTSPFNVYSCATCHTVAPGAPLVVPGRYDSGYNLAGAALRSGWWGTYETRLLGAINTCLEGFMGGRRLTEDDERARALYDYLARDGGDGGAPAAPVSVVRLVTSLSSLRGDAARGRMIYEKACARCHGAANTGAGRNGRATILPQGTIDQFGAQARAVVVEKVRHGRFFGIGGTMPFYALEVMRDEEVADILAHLGL